MKLLYCSQCHDTFSLLLNLRRNCLCGACGGWYLDNVQAEYWGPAIPLGFDNIAFKEAVTSQPKRGMGKLFSAFVIPEECKTFKKVK